MATLPIRQLNERGSEIGETRLGRLAPIATFDLARLAAEGRRGEPLLGR